MRLMGSVGHLAGRHGAVTHADHHINALLDHHPYCNHRYFTIIFLLRTALQYSDAFTALQMSRECVLLEGIFRTLTMKGKDVKTSRKAALVIRKLTSLLSRNGGVANCG